MLKIFGLKQTAKQLMDALLRSHGNANQQIKIITIRSNESKAFSNSRSSTYTFLFTILNYLRYCITTWYYGHSVLLNKLQKICNKFINKIIWTNPAKKRNEKITKNNILNIQQLYKLNISICMNKSFHRTEQNLLFCPKINTQSTSTQNYSGQEASKNPKVFKSGCSLFIINQALKNKRLQIEF